MSSCGSCSSFGRKKVVVGLCMAFFGTIFITLWARNLLSCLCAIVYCYVSWVRPHLTYITQSEIIASTSSDGGHVIPKIIHQTWKDKEVPERWQEAHRSCLDLHPDYTHYLWTDAEAREFIVHHHPWFLHTYDRYPFVIQRADVIRYFVLYKYGGSYIDLDVGCRRRLDDLRNFSVVLPLTNPLGFSNEFMMSAPEHPFMLRLVNQLQLWARSFGSKYPTVMFSTGPMFVTAQHALYRDRAGVWVLPDNFYGKYSNETEAYLKHYSGSSWHGGDAKLVFWLYSHLTLLLWVGGGLLLVALRWLVTRNKEGGGLYSSVQRVD